MRVTRENVAKSLSNLFHKEIEEKAGRAYDNTTYTKYAINGWELLRDRSIRAEKYVASDESRFSVQEVTDEFYKVEVASPILTEETLVDLFSVLSVLKGVGGIINNTTGFHVHIDAPSNIRPILQKFVSDQDSIMNGFGVEQSRAEHYAKPYKDVARILDWVLNFAYSIEEYSEYIPILSPFLLKNA